MCRHSIIQNVVTQLCQFLWLVRFVFIFLFHLGLSFLVVLVSGFCYSEFNSFGVGVLLLLNLCKVHQLAAQAFCFHNFNEILFSELRYNTVEF